MRIAVLIGSGSGESEISRQSGIAVLDGLKNLSHDPVLLSFGDNLIADILSIKPDLVFNAMHGKYGEDGTVPAMLNTIKMPYTHSGILASAIGMNKDISKKIFRYHNVPVADSFVVSHKEITNESYIETLKKYSWKKAVIKPISGGSSIGLMIVDACTNQIPSIKKYDLKTVYDPNDQFLIEEYVGGKELNVCIFGDRVEIMEVIFDGEIFDYKTKYTRDLSAHQMNPDIPSNFREQMIESARSIHNGIGCRSVSRVEFKMSSDKFVALEINTHPGMTGYSILPDIAKHYGYSFEELIDMIIKDASYES